MTKERWFLKWKKKTKTKLSILCFINHSRGSKTSNLVRVLSYCVDLFPKLISWSSSASNFTVPSVSCLLQKPKIGTNTLVYMVIKTAMPKFAKPSYLYIATAKKKLRILFIELRLSERCKWDTKIKIDTKRKESLCPVTKLLGANQLPVNK